MNLRRIKHTLLRLSAEEKVIGGTSLIIFLGTFMPWYSVVMNFDKKSLTETGFSGDLGVIGFVIFLMSIITGLVLVAENMHLPLPQFGYKRDQILFFFLGQSFFLTLLTMAIYTKRGLEFTDASLRFGIYTVLIASFFGALSAFALLQKAKRKEVEEFFHQEEDTTEMSDIPEEEAAPEVHEEPAPEPEPEPEPEPMFFEEDEQAMPDPDLVVEKTEQFSDYVPEDDMIEDVQEAPAEVQEDLVQEEPTEEKKEGGSSVSMGFYDDK